MTNKERVLASFAGLPVDRYPVIAMYIFLTYMDRFEELTGRPQWRLDEWLSSSPEEYIQLYGQMLGTLPFEMLQPNNAPTHEKRERIEYVVKGGRPYRHDKKTDEYTPVSTATASGHAHDGAANEEQFVYDKNDVDGHVHITKAEAAISQGLNDYIEAVVTKFGENEFIVSGGVIGTTYLCHKYVGLTNLFAMMLEKPDLVDYLANRILENNIETIRRLAAAGGNAIYIDDAMTTNDMISVEHYERFSLPHMRTMVDEIHNLGHKAILIYFGGIADRLNQIASIGADGLLMEASMKGYTNDVGAVIDQIGRNTTLFGNIDPISIIQNSTDTEMEAEIRRQANAGKHGRGFMLSPASPLTPGTSLDRIRDYIDMCKQIGQEINMTRRGA